MKHKDLPQYLQLHTAQNIQTSEHPSKTFKHTTQTLLYTLLPTQQVINMTDSSSNISSKQALVEPVDVYFRILLPFGIVPPDFENCVPQVPAAEPWEEESYTPPRKQRSTMRPPPVLTDKCDRDLLAMLSPPLPPTPTSPVWDGHDAVCADPPLCVSATL